MKNRLCFVALAAASTSFALQAAKDPEVARWKRSQLKGHTEREYHPGN
jgi:hypothetical protein